MFDWNRFGSYEYIGKASILVGQLDDTDNGTNLWYELEEQDSGASNGLFISCCNEEEMRLTNGQRGQYQQRVLKLVQAMQMFFLRPKEL
jgi:hypothetical protein